MNPIHRSPPLAQHPYASFVHEVERPARYLGGEWGQIVKPWEQASVRVCLAFPDLYDLGMSHLGTRILYNLLNAPQDVLCERAFSPWFDMEEQLRKRGLPVVSLESAKPLSAFDVVGISLQHELVFTNVLTLLELGGIPLRASQREEHDPLVVGGGSVSTHPEPVAPFFDAFVVGEGERKALEVVRQWVDDRDAGVPRHERLARLAALGGVYVPSLYASRVEDATGRVVVDAPLRKEAPLPVRREVIEQIDEFPFPEVFPTGGPEAVFERLSFEIARGCMQGCRFCQAGMIFRPQRERDPAQLVNSIAESIRRTGQDEISLTSLSTADYSCIGPLVREVAARTRKDKVSVGVSSLRAYGLTDQVLEDIRRVRATGLTFAPEAGTQRMRDVINKNISEEQITSAVERALTRGWDKVKLYFMIGLPTETLDDVMGIIETTGRVRSTGRRSRGSKAARPVRVTASASTFVPKPHTPFQWEGMDDFDTVQKKHRMLHDAAFEQRIELKTHEPHASVLEGVMSRGDRLLANVIEAAWRGGARFDAWDGHVKWDVWMQAMQASGLTVSEYLKGSPADAMLPWSHIDIGVEPSFLLSERDKALRAKTTAPCGQPFLRDGQPVNEDKLVCFRCGIGCDTSEMRDRRHSAREGLVSIADGRHGRGKGDESPNSLSESALPETSAQPARYRLTFEKLGRAAYLGHLDLVREVPRIFRRAGALLWYSQGFHPKPLMTFSAALPLGVPSFEEAIDIKTREPLSKDAFLERVNQEAPDGLRFLEMVEVAPGASSAAAGLQSAEWLLGLDPDAVAAIGGVAILEERIAKLLAATQLEVERTRKGNTRRLDIRSLIEDLRLGTDDDLAIFERAGVAGQWQPLRMHVRFDGQSSVRMDEIATALLGEFVVVRAVRIALRWAERPVAAAQREVEDDRGAVSVSE